MKRTPFTYSAPDPFADLLDGLPVEATYTITATTDLPARLYGGNAQAVEVTGLDYTLHLDLQKLPESEAPTSNDGKWTVVWDEPNNVYKRVEFTSLPGGVGPSSTYIGDQPPNEPTEGQLWWESDSGQMFIWYTDANSSQWVPATIQPSNVMGGVGTLGNVYDTIHIARLTIVPVELKTITLSGYNRPGDSGPAMPCRRTAGPVTLHDGWFRTADRFTDAGVVDAVNGGYWEYAGTNQALWLEWFGGKGDYYIVAQDGSGGVVNPTPTDNHGPFMSAMKFLYVYGYSGGIAAGPTIQIGHGAYYVSALITFDRSLCVRGMGTGYGHDSANSRLIWPAGSAGIAVHTYTEPAPNNKGASGSIIRDLFLQSLGFAGQTTKAGIRMSVAIAVEHCSVTGFGGPGIDISADVGVGSNANGFYLSHSYIYNNAMDGVLCASGDSNAGIGIGLNFVANGRWAINDASFLGNSWYACHTAGNGDYYTGYGGPYRGVGGGLNSIEFVSCYAEGDQPPSSAGEGVSFRGGTHGSGVVFAGGIQESGRGRVGGVDIRTSYTDTMPVSFKMNANSIFNIGGIFDFRYGANDSIAMRFGETSNVSFGVTPTEGSTYRDPRIGPNAFLVPGGMFIGGGLGFMRRLGNLEAPPAVAGLPNDISFLRGDIFFDRQGRQGGWICTADGVTVANWVSGTAYAKGAYVRNSAGKVYECTRIPYDPDRWSRPPATVLPSHTTGTVHYPEPNPEIDPGEAATIPGYNWGVRSCLDSFAPWSYIQGKVWNEEVGFFHPSNGLCYSVALAGLPQAPTPIFNTPWAMPASTLEPTHATGTIEYPQPNPSPSGSEPATIPGYVWRFVTANPAAKWAGFGEVFLDSTYLLWAPPAIATGASSAVQTLAVAGAALGDFVEVTGLYTGGGGVQGLIINAWISAPDVVSFMLHNLTGATVTLGETGWYARVRKRSGIGPLLLESLRERLDDEQEDYA